VGLAEPLLRLDTNLPKLQAVRWNPADENVVGVVCSFNRQLQLYDLQHTQVGQSTSSPKPFRMSGCTNKQRVWQGRCTR
jgi:hypothetical protein